MTAFALHCGHTAWRILTSVQVSHRVRAARAPGPPTQQATKPPLPRLAHSPPVPYPAPPSLPRFAAPAAPPCLRACSAPSAQQAARSKCEEGRGGVARRSAVLQGGTTPALTPCRPGRLRAGWCLRREPQSPWSRRHFSRPQRPSPQSPAARQTLLRALRSGRSSGRCPLAAGHGRNSARARHFGRRVFTTRLLRRSNSRARVPSGGR